MLGAAACALTVASMVAIVVLFEDHDAAWDQPFLIAVLVALAITGDRLRIVLVRTAELTASFPAIVLAAVLAGPGPGLIAGIATTLLQPRKRPVVYLNDLLVYATWPVALGFTVASVVRATGLPGDNPVFGVLVAAGFFVSTAFTFVAVPAVMSFLDGAPLRIRFLENFRPLAAAEVAASLLTGLVAVLVGLIGVWGLVVAAVLLGVYARMQLDLMRVRTLATEAQQQADHLAEMHVGILRALLDAVHARDRMTARHSAAVSRYATRIAAAAGCDREEQELVHTAALLHDIGKFIFTDDIFWSRRGLDEEQWAIVKRHPDAGADIVGRLAGFEEVAEIIRCHHERPDGTGYPRGLAGEAIPRFARMISVADTYDVLTGRDTYREPWPPERAIAELRRVAGEQLDAELVEIFVTRVLEGAGAAFRHGDDADFTSELDFESRVRRYARTGGPGREPGAAEQGTGSAEGVAGPAPQRG